MSPDCRGRILKSLFSLEPVSCRLLQKDSHHKKVKEVYKSIQNDNRSVLFGILCLQRYSFQHHSYGG